MKRMQAMLTYLRSPAAWRMNRYEIIVIIFAAALIAWLIIHPTTPEFGPNEPKPTHVTPW